MVTKQKQGSAARVGRVETTAGAMAVYEYGHDGVPLVLLHANAHDHADYQPVIPALAEKYRVIAIDAPGHGASAWAFDPAEITAVKIADVQAEVVARLGLKRPAFIGNSIGGFTALRYALKNPGDRQTAFTYFPAQPFRKNYLRICIHLCWKQKAAP